MADGNPSTDVSNTAASPKGDEGPVLVPGAGTAAAKPPMPKHLRPGRKWNLPAPPKYSARTVWTLMALSSLAIAILWVAIAELMMPTINTKGPPALGKEFKDGDNSFRIRPPLNWTVEDPHDGPRNTTNNVYFKAPHEKLFSPLIITSLEIAPGRLTTYIQEHKARILVQDKSAKFDEKEEDEDVIDGCRTWVLVYDVDLPTDEKNDDGSVRLVKVRTLQYILDDHPRFYRITCHVRADQYEKFKARFSAAAHSITRDPLPLADVKR